MILPLPSVAFIGSGAGADTGSNRKSIRQSCIQIDALIFETFHNLLFDIQLKDLFGHNHEDEHHHEIIKSS